MVTPSNYLSEAMVRNSTRILIRQMDRQRGILKAFGFPAPTPLTRTQRFRRQVRVFIRDKREALGAWIAGRSFDEDC